MENLLFLKFKEMVAWYREACEKEGITSDDIIEKLPEFWKAMQEKLADMEKAYFEDSLHGMEEAMGKVKKIYYKAVERLK